MLLSISKQTFPKTQGQLVPMIGIIKRVIPPKDKTKSNSLPILKLRIFSKFVLTFQSFLVSLRGGSLHYQRAPSIKDASKMNRGNKSVREIPCHITQASTPSPQNFFSFGPWLDTLKLERIPIFLALASSGILLFQSFGFRPSGQKMSAAMQKWELPYISRFQFLREVFTQ